MDESANFLADASSLFIRQSPIDTSLLSGPPIPSDSIVTAEAVPSSTRSQKKCSRASRTSPQSGKKPGRLQPLSTCYSLMDLSSLKFDATTYNCEFSIKSDYSSPANSNKRLTSSATVALHERLYAFKTSVQEKLKAARAAQDQEVVQECTFSPQVNSNNKRLRTAAEFYRETVRLERVRQKRIEALKEAANSELSDCTFRPALCNESRKLAHTSLALQGNTYERLAKCKVAWQSAELSDFTPAINTQSSRLIRSRPVEELLYADAVRRRTDKGPKIQDKAVKVLARSEQLLVSTFLREVQQAKAHVRIGETVNYTRMTSFLASLGFIKDSIPTQSEACHLIEFWNILERTGSSFANLQVIVMGLMNYFQPWMNTNQSFRLTRQATKSFHQKHHSLYRTRASQQVSSKVIHTSSSQPQLLRGSPSSPL